MTHFITAVYVPKTNSLYDLIFTQGNDFSNALYGVLDKYNEQSDVEPYIEYTKSDAIVEARDHIARIKKHNIQKGEAQKNAEYEGWGDEECYHWFAKQYYADNIDSEGAIYSTYNKDSVYDYFQVLRDDDGGWINWLGDARATQPGFVLKQIQEELEANSKPSKDETRRTIPGQFVYPTTLNSNAEWEWLSEEKVGWFAMSSTLIQRDEFLNKVADALGSAPEGRIIYLDCHI